MIEYSTARLFITGSVPGRPRTCSSTSEFGSAPKLVAPLAAAVNILVCVASWTWISMPIRTLYELDGALWHMGLEYRRET